MGVRGRFSLSGPKIEKLSLESFRPCPEECFSTPGWLDIPTLECCKIRFLKSFPATGRALTEAFIQYCKVNSKEFTYKWKFWKKFFTIFDLSEFWSKFGFSISHPLTSLRSIEYSTPDFDPKKWLWRIFEKFSKSYLDRKIWRYMVRKLKEHDLKGILRPYHFWILEKSELFY